MKTKNICPVCLGPGGSPVYMCHNCERSYDTTLGGDMISVIVWAAKRARYFERKRAKLEARLKRAGLL